MPGSISGWVAYCCLLIAFGGSFGLVLDYVWLPAGVCCGLVLLDGVLGCGCCLIVLFII